MGKLDVSELGKPTYLKYELSITIDLAQRIGFRSVYVLVDRVDESELTGNDAHASFKLVEPLLLDLSLLELKGLAIKFFLWDQLQSFYDDIARKDRVQDESLDWDEEMLKNMWGKRLSAYSRGGVSNLSDISLRAVMPYSIDELALIFANGSLRDMIRIGRQIIVEQLQVDPFVKYISPEATYRAIDKFCEKRAAELSPKNLNSFRKIQRVDFTIPYLANNVFREQQPNTRSRIVAWRREGNIIDIDKVDNPNPEQNQQVKLIGFADVRIAKVIYPDLDIPSFLKSKYRRCPRCGAGVIREWGDKISSPVCHACQFDLATDAQRDPQEQWRRRQMAAQTRTRRRREVIEAQQLKMDFVSLDTAKKEME